MKTKKRRPLLVLNFLKRSAYRAAVQPHTLGLAIALVSKFRYNANRSKGKKMTNLLPKHRNGSQNLNFVIKDLRMDPKAVLQKPMV